MGTTEHYLRLTVIQENYVYLFAQFNVRTDSECVEEK